MSDDPAADLARMVARRLDGTTGAITPEVEAALHRRQASPEPDRYVVDPISLGGLIVSIATLVWTIYSDLRKHSPAPEPATVARTIRVRLREERDAPELDPDERDRVIEIAVDEVTRHQG